jgi:hypothetical protein
MVVLCSFDGPKFVKTRITKDITVSLPADFTPMSDDDMAKKYYTYRKPTAMYTNQDRVIDFGLNQTATPWRQQDLPMLKDVYKESIRTMYTKVDFMQDSIVTLNKRNFIVFEFLSEVVDDDPASLRKGSVVRQYSYLQYTIKDNKVLIFNFTCPAQFYKKWQETARKIMESIKVA